MTLREFHRPTLWLGIWVFGWFACVALSLLPPVRLGAPPDSDKVGHFLAYFTLSAWAMQLFARRRGQAVAAASLVALGIALEIAQAQLTVERLGDPRDALANTLGVFAGLVTAATPLANVLQRIDRKWCRRSGNGAGGN